MEITCLTPKGLKGINYKPPHELPGGWWDALGSLAGWVKRQLREAYESGYMAGKLDGLRWAHDAADVAADAPLMDSLMSRRPVLN